MYVGSLFSMKKKINLNYSWFLLQAFSIIYIGIIIKYYCCNINIINVKGFSITKD